ncbi:hypothetical protein RFI_00070 [Reticulomyxa filosa]|uniref:Amine oxidase n=1 Tax=Reticulomyxa filosa TaxID=46433 RepID=X6PG42_RETFI|nr:hypothetical protein RFI_00070 [Reticulomyxa filosa]|eukprot:ETO36994.1 hypothetical protein RFI_00070 [Reticulomyxa filosa]
MPMGCIIKTCTFYEEAWWKTDGNSGFMSDLDRSGPVIVTFDDCKPDGTCPALMGFILANESRKYADMTYEERKDAVCRQYADIFQNKKALEPVAYHEKPWNKEEFSRGCYFSVPTPGLFTFCF